MAYNAQRGQGCSGQFWIASTLTGALAGLVFEYLEVTANWLTVPPFVVLWVVIYLTCHQLADWDANREDGGGAPPNDSEAYKRWEKEASDRNAEYMRKQREDARREIDAANARTAKEDARRARREAKRR